MIDYDFIEIGTSNFNTLIETANDETIGISIEPISYYLNQLPNRKNVTKINCAISIDDIEKQTNIFYIPEHVIKEKSLPKYLRGCNTINTYHKLHIEQGLTDLVVVETVKQVPISKIFIDYKVKSVKHLKIDTEGCDSDILLCLYKYLQLKDQAYFPKKITFESTSLTLKSKIDLVIEKYSNLGYKVDQITKLDTVLVFS